MGGASSYVSEHRFSVWRMTNQNFGGLPQPIQIPGGAFRLSTDALTLIALVGACALALVAVALLAPLALLAFVIAGAIGLNREVRRWRAAGPI